jgi:hypothetical protein
MKAENNDNNNKNNNKKKVEVKLKVKMSLCLNRAPRHEGVLGNGGIAPLIL